MKKDFNHVLLSNIIDSFKLLLIAIGIATSVAQGAVESSNEAESSPISFESRPWAEAVMSAASASDSIIIEGGRLKANAVWAPPKTHLVFNSVYVPKGITLTIVTNCVVKFCEGTFIKIEDGGTLNIVGEEGKEVILTSANDNTVGTTIPKLDPEQVIEFKGIVLQSSAAKFNDNGWLEIRGFVCSLFPSISISNQTVYRSTGQATIPVTVTGTRNRSFMIDWVAEDGTATLSNDYTVASGRITWEKTGTKKNIEIPILKDHITGSNTTFTVRIKAAYGANIVNDIAVITISEMLFHDIDSDFAESNPIRFESRSWAEAVYNAAITNKMIIIEGGRLEEDTIWAPPETHLVFNSVYIPSGITLTIVTNTVVKFCEGTFIKVEDGGKLNIAGAEDEDVILTAANDNTVGEPIIGLDPDQTIEFSGIILQSSNATLTDNGWLQNKGFKISGYPSLSLADVEVFRSTGLASVKVSISGTRYQSFSIDWEAEDGTATFSNDYTIASGRLTWSSTSEGSKNIEIPLVADHNVGSNTTFKVKVTTARGININNGECTVTIKELDVNTFNFEYDSEESASIRFESRPWAKAVMDAASTNNMIVLEGGRLKKNTTWGPPKTHLVFNSVYVPNGITLTIVTNTVVKFCEGTFIKVEDGGKLNITGAEGKEVILTAANDNTVGKTIPGLDPKETIVFKGIVFSSNNATFTDNGYLETRGFIINRYPTLSLHEATANRKSGVIYIPITIDSVYRNQRFSIDWVAEEGTAKFNKDYTVASGSITWANSYEGQKNIEIPIVKDHIVGDNATFTVRFSALYGVNAAVKEITATIAEFKSGELTSDTVVELNDSELSPSTPVDEGIQLRPFFLNDIETIRYSGKWQKYDATKADKLRVTVESDNGLSILKEAAPSEEGSFELKVSDYPVGFYTLKHEIVDAQGTTLAIMQKNFSIMDKESVIWHGGTLTQNEVWTSNKVHVVYATVYVPTTYTLFIEPGTIVKFMRGTGIELLGEAAFFADAIVFTTIDDDTIGGDTLNDGYTGKPPVDCYFLVGNFHFSGDTELRNITQVEPLKGTISTNKLLNRGCIYRVSGSLNITSGGVLTIPPGTILKMESGASINVGSGGVLNANGTHAAPVIITSIKDDSVGGDTNKDGDKTFPEPGDWSSIVVGGAANFEYTSIAYGGNDAFDLQGGAVSFSNSTLSHILQYGVALESGSWAMTNSVFRDFYTAFRHWGSGFSCVNSVFYDMTYLSNNGGQNFINCVIANYAAALCWWSDNCTYKNCVFWNPEDFGPQNTEKHGINGNIWGNPLFVDPENGDFRIVEGSPCVDAADSQIAPETDYFGQPRITITDQGTNTVGQLADIGICEVMPRNIAGDVDLVPLSINSITNAVPGQALFIKWEVANIGGKDMSGSWRDTVSLVSLDGRQVELGTKKTTSTIGAGGSVFCSGYFYVPAISEGIWFLKVNVNSYHDIFEGSLIGNNTLLGDTFINISIDTFDHSIYNQGIAYSGIQNVIKLKFDENDENRMISITLPKGVKISWGFGSVPVSGVTFGSTTSNGSAPVQFRVPEGVTDVYVVIETDETITYDLSTGNAKSVISDITPRTIPCAGTTTLSITGAGFEQDTTVSFVKGGNIINPEYIFFNNSQQITVTVDGSCFVPGQAYDVVVQNNNSSDTFYNAVSVMSVQGEGNFWFKANIPEMAREGRIASVAVDYGNNGTADIDLQIIRVKANGGKVRLSGSSGWDETINLVATGCARKESIAPGESSRLFFEFKAGASNKITMFSSFDAEIDVSPWASRSDFFDDIKKVTSDLYAVGGDINNWTLIYKTALSMKTDKSYLVGGKVIDDNNSDPVFGAKITLYSIKDDKSTNLYAVTTSDENGKFYFVEVEKGTYFIDTGSLYSIVMKNEGSYYNGGAFTVKDESLATSLLLSLKSEKSLCLYLDGEGVNKGKSTVVATKRINDGCNGLIQAEYVRNEEAYFFGTVSEPGVYSITAEQDELAFSALVYISGERITRVRGKLAPYVTLSGTISEIKERRISDNEPVKLMIYNILSKKTLLIDVMDNGKFSCERLLPGDYILKLMGVSCSYNFDSIYDFKNGGNIELNFSPYTESSKIKVLYPSELSSNYVVVVSSGFGAQNYLRTSSKGSVEFSSLADGIWTCYLLDLKGNTIDKKNVQLTNGEGVVEFDKLPNTLNGIFDILDDLTDQAIDAWRSIRQSLADEMAGWKCWNWLMEKLEGDEYHMGKEVLAKAEELLNYIPDKPEDCECGYNLRKYDRDLNAKHKFVEFYQVFAKYISSCDNLLTWAYGFKAAGDSAELAFEVGVKHFLSPEIASRLNKVSKLPKVAYEVQEWLKTSKISLEAVYWQGVLMRDIFDLCLEIIGGDFNKDLSLLQEALERGDNFVDITEHMLRMMAVSEYIDDKEMSEVFPMVADFISLVKEVVDVVSQLHSVADDVDNCFSQFLQHEDIVDQFDLRYNRFISQMEIYRQLVDDFNKYHDLVCEDPASNPVCEPLTDPFEFVPQMMRSGDPNEMSGPLGIGDPETERFVVPGEWLTYTVYFENTSNATAAAQEVYVTNPLNKYLDWSSFEMGDIAFNNQIDLGLAGKQSGTSEVAANGESYNVRTQLELDKEKGEVKWYMRIVDPSTETGWPDDILVGFLPPNDETYRGEGHLSYRIKVREDAPAGVTINNAATIVFDYNDPIETDPAWWNKVAQTQKVSFDDGSTNVNLVVGMPYGKLPVPGERKGWTFVGWFTGPDGTGRQITEDSIVEEGDDMLYQHWVRNKHDLVDDDKGMAVASVYDGYVYDPVENRTTKGSIQAKVGKTKNGKAKVSATIVMAGGEKTEIKGEMDTATGTLTATAKNGRPTTLTFGENDLSGTYGEYEIDGARNLFVSKNGNDQATANAALAAWGGVHTMVWDDGPGYAVASISIGSKGKTKVVGWMGNGTKFSASGQLIVGKKESCVTIVSTNNRTPLAFNLWFEAGEETEFEGISDYAIISTVGPLVPDAFFMCDFLTESVPIVIQKGKWTVNTSKETALKLSYKDKTGTFKGSFKVNKQKAIVNGVVVDGVGYGSAVMKNAGFMPVVIDSVKEE